MECHLHHTLMIWKMRSSMTRIPLNRLLIMNCKPAPYISSSSMVLTSKGCSHPPSTSNDKEAVYDRADRYNAPPLPSHRTMNLVSTDPSPSSEPNGVLSFSNNQTKNTSAKSDGKLRCWDHGCNGREFSSKSNFVRHRKEKEGEAAMLICPLCGATFTRSSARDTHVTRQSCNRIRRYSNGRPRPSKIALLSSLGFTAGTH